ncbi:MAG: protein kinase [Candidatus Contendobacter sp.]|nr:protein kinase [Candidatus Contendobacter sp.]
MIIAGKYEVIGELGKGGMGVVYQVRHLELGSIFALKVLRADLTDETVEAVARFYNEARVMARLRHPHIIQVFDIGQDAGRHYFVMEYIRGRNLYDILKQEGALPLSKALTIGAQVGEALAYAHTQQPPVVHRDIKPHNIMLEDGTNRVVVMDFGIAKLLDPQHTQYTHTGVFLGTLAYSAPEQLRSTMKIDGRADIFSLGLVLYEMATGRKFFLGLTREEIIGKQLFEPGVYLPAFERPVPRVFQRLVAKAIMKDRDRRYNTVTELLEALAKVPVGGRISPWTWATLTGGVSLAALAAVIGWRWNQDWHWNWDWRGAFTSRVEHLLAAPKPEPAKPEPAKLVAKLEPVKPEPVKPQPVKPEPANPEPAKPEPAKPEPAKPVDHPAPPAKENPVTPATPPPSVPHQEEEKQATPTLATVKPAESPPTAPLVQPIPVAVIQPPTPRIAAPKPTPPAPSLSAIPPAGRILLKVCETQTFTVNDNPPHRYIWWIDGQPQTEQGQRLLFSGQSAGQHTVRVAVNGNEATGASWEVGVVPAPPSETEVRQWLEAYRQALETENLAKLRELGYVRSDSQAEAMREKFRMRPQNQVRIQDWQAEALRDEVRLSFEQADRWRDTATRSLVMDYSSQSVTLVRQDCTRVVAR